MKRLSLISVLCLSVSVLATAAHAQGDTYIRDTLSDTGAEPYTGPGPVYLSPDIWVRKEPDPNFSPYPFPTASPTWTPASHENPEYRDSKTGKPNYVYVRIHNRGSSPTTGTERLRLYQAKAGTGLAWPANWIDYVANACGQDLLHGIEVTKPRRNALDVTQAEFDRYVNVVTEISTNSAYQYSDGVQYWQKQQSVHADLGNPEHGNPSFLPWHREMVNRYEERLKESDPLVTLLYWDWTESLLDLINQGFIGPVSGNFSFGGVNMSRAIPDSNCSFDSDATLLSSTYNDYQDFALRLENWPRNHDCGHVYIGGDMSSTATAAQDPIFFVHHANVDRLWATWQRDDAAPALLDPATAYGGDTSDTSINSNMSPWDGATATLPWQGGSTTVKTSKHRSIVYPPIYDTAPLNIPVLQPLESVVIEIPWYPPNVNSFNCSGDAGHFCLLARIETDASAPYGMTFNEGTSVSTNTRNNNGIAWKNLTIVDDEVEPLFFVSGTSIHNFFEVERFFDIRLIDRTERRPHVLHEFADVALILPERILDRLDGREAVRDFKLTEMKGVDQPVLMVAGENPALRLVMKPGERFNVQFAVRLRDDEPADALLREPFHFDIEQALNVPEEFIGIRNEARFVGGVRFTLDVAELLKPEADKRTFDLAQFSIDLRSETMKTRAELVRPAGETPHVSPGEPVELSVRPDAGRSLRSLSVTVDGREIARGERALDTETLRFEEPGVHRIVVEGLDEDGQIVRREERVLVSANIPPTVTITEPGDTARAQTGETVMVTAVARPAYERSVKEMTFHVREGTQIEGGFNLVRSEAFPPVERARGGGPHRFSFTPERPGMYMLQVGAVDDDGNIGVSGHVMVMVAE